jgi:hypothetical protein
VLRRLERYFGEEYATKASNQALKTLKEDIAKDLGNQGLGRREAAKAANKAIDKYKKGLDEGFKADHISVKVVGETVSVTLSAVSTAITEEAEDKAQEEFKGEPPKK